MVDTSGLGLQPVSLNKSNQLLITTELLFNCFFFTLSTMFSLSVSNLFRIQENMDYESPLIILNDKAFQMFLIVHFSVVGLMVVYGLWYSTYWGYPTKKQEIKDWFCYLSNPEMKEHLPTRRPNKPSNNWRDRAHLMTGTKSTHRSSQQTYISLRDENDEGVQMTDLHTDRYITDRDEQQHRSAARNPLANRPLPMSPQQLAQWQRVFQSEMEENEEADRDEGGSVALNGEGDSESYQFTPSPRSLLSREEEEDVKENTDK
jgi:hypothetical protein